MRNLVLTKGDTLTRTHYTVPKKDSSYYLNCEVVVDLRP